MTAVGLAAGLKANKEKNGAGDGNRTHVRSLGSFYSAIELRPRRSKRNDSTILRKGLKLDCNLWLRTARRARAVAKKQRIQRGSNRNPWERRMNETCGLLDDRVVEIILVQVGDGHFTFAHLDEHWLDTASRSLCPDRIARPEAS